MSPTPAAERAAEIETPKELAIRLEAFETPQWAIDEILKVELLTQCVVDPCCGRGAMSEGAIVVGYDVWPWDVHDWGYPKTKVREFLGYSENSTFGCDTTVFMNPPFSLAEQFVVRAIEMGARKILCFQRFSWWESQRRKKFWDKHPPNRIYICGDRATCWRFDIDPENPIHPETGKKMGNVPTAHAWFVWEFGQPPGPVISRIYKDAP